MEKVSDIKKVNKLSRMIYKKTVEPSTRKNKKYMIIKINNRYEFDAAPASFVVSN